MTISDELFDKMRECWEAQIPAAYKYAGHSASDRAKSAVVALPPSRSSPLVMTEKQKAALAKALWGNVR